MLLVEEIKSLLLNPSPIRIFKNPCQFVLSITIFSSWFVAGLALEFLRFKSLSPLFSYTDVGLGFFVFFIMLVNLLVFVYIKLNEVVE